MTLMVPIGSIQGIPVFIVHATTHSFIQNTIQLEAANDDNYSI